MTYEAVAKFAQQGGSIYFVVMFSIAVIYALWPKNRGKFDELSKLPLKDDEKP